MTHNITGELLKKMILNAAAAIENNKKELNDLNVFPVPDGDTGTNMSLTIGAAETALSAMTPGTIGHAAEVSAGAMLRGARGNSGVILSLLVRGFSRRLKDLDTADSATFAEAMAAGVDAAYKAVMKPTEGTILTVSRMASGEAVLQAEKEKDIAIVLERALEAGNIALAETINQNPVLTKAGVIDAGAKGYIYMLDGMLRAVRGEVLVKAAPEQEASAKADFAQFDAEDIKFAYCTELMIERKSKRNVNLLRDFLDRRGDSVVVIDDDEVIKLHIHTNEPGVIMTESLKYGPLLTIKIENMHEQHSEAVSEAASGETVESPKNEPQEPEEMKEFGVVAVCVGDGIEAIFRDLGADRVILGGQTMNPSTEDILKKINETPSNVVFVLPNNKNIIMAAQQCIPLTEKKVIVIPTRTIPQGVSALLTLNDDTDTDAMTENMTEAAKCVRTAHITLAARDSDFDGHSIKEGEFLALLEDSLVTSGVESDMVIDTVAESLKKFAPEFITIYSGEEISEDEAEATASRIGAIIPDVEIEIAHGGQPIYHYIISAE